MSVEQKFSSGYVKKYTEIHFKNASRMKILLVQKECSSNIFSDTKQKYVCWKNCKGFERNSIVKWVTFCWLWNFLLENLNFLCLRERGDEYKKEYVRTNIFKKRISNMTFWMIYILVQISCFPWGLLYGVLVGVLFLNF